MEHFATTPFGGARLTAQNFSLRADLDKRRTRLKAEKVGDDEDTATPEKWRIIRALSEARGHWGLSDRSIAVLEALASFHRDRHLDGRKPIIVFPSNAELSIRARGMSPATLRRHLAALVEAGLILRRDSANGKRYCRRDARGQVESAFGFDLSPLALRTPEILACASFVREEARRIAHLRAEISLHLRDIAKIVAAALLEPGPAALSDDWLSFAARLQSLSGRVTRGGREADHRLRRDALLRLRAEVETTYLQALPETALTEREMSADAHHSERHIQNSETDIPFEKDGFEQEAGRDIDETIAPERKSIEIAVSDLVRRCPHIADYSRGGTVRGWADVVAAAEVVRTMLGVSHSAWAAARRAMGDIGAAITIAAMLERVDTIRSPGGYLRDLTEKAARGRFSVRPMLSALA